MALWRNIKFRSTTTDGPSHPLSGYSVAIIRDNGPVSVLLSVVSPLSAIWGKLINFYVSIIVTLIFIENHFVSNKMSLLTFRNQKIWCLLTARLPWALRTLSPVLWVSNQTNYVKIPVRVLLFLCVSIEHNSNENVSRCFKLSFANFGKIMDLLGSINLSTNKEDTAYNFWQLLDNFWSESFNQKVTFNGKFSVSLDFPRPRTFLFIFRASVFREKGLPQILQSMSISSSPLLFIVCSFLAIVSAAAFFKLLFRSWWLRCWKEQLLT